MPQARLERRQPSQDIRPVISDGNVRNVSVIYVETVVVVVKKVGVVVKDAGGTKRTAIVSRGGGIMWEFWNKTMILGHFSVLRPLEY